MKDCVKLVKLTDTNHKLIIVRDYGSYYRQLRVYFTDSTPLAFMNYKMGRIPTLYVNKNLIDEKYGSFSGRIKRHFYVVEGELRNSFMTHKTKHVDEEMFLLKLRREMRIINCKE